MRLSFYKFKLPALSLLLDVNSVCHSLHFTETTADYFRTQNVQSPENVGDSARLVESDLNQSETVLSSDSLCHSLFAAIDDALKTFVEILGRTFVMSNEFDVFPIVIEVSFTFTVKDS